MLCPQNHKVNEGDEELCLCEYDYKWESRALLLAFDS